MWRTPLQRVKHLIYREMSSPFWGMFAVSFTLWRCLLSRPMNRHGAAQTLSVYLYLRGGVLLVWWWELLLQSRHLLN